MRPMLAPTDRAGNGSKGTCWRAGRGYSGWKPVLLSPAETTYLVTRLERDGLVLREVDPADGCKWFTVLTDEGDDALRAARPTHNAVLRRTLLAATSPTDRRTLRRIWRRVSAQGSTPLGDGP